MSAETPPLLGDKYRLVRPLDKGGMGSVWLAEHLALASPVAIKLITADVAKTSDRLQRFLREARAAAAARSPHVVQILDYGVHEGTPYIVMELLEGESLAERLQRRGRLDTSETELVIRHVSRAITRAHDAGIVHRDLKPANIFITHNEEEEVVKIFDFGIAKAAESLGGAGLGKATRAGSLLGTPYYMSPEQLEGGRRSDHRSDIWAMGVIAFECLLGRLPFSGQGIGGLVLAVCSNPLPVPSQVGEVPEGFDAWFAHACSRDLARRFSSAREAALELRRVLGVQLDPSSSAPQPSRVETPLEPGVTVDAGGHRRVIGGTVAIGAGVLAAAGAWGTPGTAGAVADAAGHAAAVAHDVNETAVLPPTTADPSSSTLDPEPPPRRPAPWVLVAPIVACVAIALAVQGIRRSSRADDTAPPAAAPAPARAGLIVLGQGSELRANVDGQDIGPVPCEVQQIEPGEHTVTISGNERYRPSHHRVHLDPGEVETIGPVKLEVAKGLATIVAGEGAVGAELSLSVGDSTLRLPALPVQLDVETAQLHVLHAERPGFEPYHQRLSFEEGDAEKQFAITLSPLPHDDPPPKKAAKSKGRRPSARRRPRASSKVDAAKADAAKADAADASKPDAAKADAAKADAAKADAPTPAAPSTFTFTATPDASVLLDGEPLGSTPLHDVRVAPGSHRVIFIRGAQRKAMLVVGVAGREKLVSASFATQREK